MQLIPPTLEYKESYEEALKEFEEAGDMGFWVEFGNPRNVEEYIQKCKDFNQGIGLPEGWVPGSTFWLIDDEEFIGHTNIRHELNDHLRKIGGHIGYYIRPTKRGQGYGTAILKLALVEAKKLGLDKVLITCDEDNERSRRVIEANGGVFECKNPYDDQPAKLLYWIEP